MAQVRFIIIHPQTNASFVRRLVGIAETSNIIIELFTNFTALKNKHSTLDDESVIVTPQEFFHAELQSYCALYKTRVICWSESLETAPQIAQSTVWHCLGDPFRGMIFQTVAALMTSDKKQASKRWMVQGKWGSLNHRVTGTPQAVTEEFSSFIKKLKTSNHNNIRKWENLARDISKEKIDQNPSMMEMSCDGNQLKLHWEIGEVTPQALSSFVMQAKQLHNIIIRFEVANCTLVICCEIGLHGSASICPAVVIIGQSSSPQKDEIKWEEAG